MSRNKIILLVLGIGGTLFLVFSLVIILIVWFAFGVVNNYGQLVTDHFQKIEDGQVEEAYREDTSQIFKDSTTLSEYKNFTEQYSVFENFESFSARSVNRENDRLSIQGTVNGEDGQTVPVEINMIKENDEWKIVNISFE
jgi:hypothetical protein